MNQDPLVVVRATKYPLDAFEFVTRGLDFTVRRVHGEPQAKGEEPGSRHVTGRDLCHGLRDYAVEQYGLLARTVLARWHIRHCEDFGNIVFTLVEAGLMRKTDEDSIRDFRNVFDFETAFHPSLKLSEAT